jgi:hypothetical protein
MSQNLIEIKVQGNKINISGELSIKFQVAKEFSYLGNQEIIIYDTNKVFHYVFAKCSNKHLSKLFFLQYEFYLPHIVNNAKATFNYKSLDKLQLGNLEWIRDNFIDKTTYADWDKISDVYQLMKFVEAKNCIFPPRTFTNRLAKVINKEKTHELLILYLEDINERKWNDLNLNGEIVEQKWKREQIDLNQRALSAFKVL